MTNWYTLDGKTPVLAGNILDGSLEWARWCADNLDSSRVALDFVEGVRVSTMFLGLDHNFYLDGPPVLFETMVFWDGHPLDHECERYATWDEAEAGHGAMMARVVEAIRVENARGVVRHLEEAE